MKQVVIWFIKLYQKVPGPWHNYCRHYPTCSNYAIEALNEFGFFKGSYLSIIRILKCNPFGTSGYDPVPNKKGERKNEKM